MLPPILYSDKTTNIVQQPLESVRPTQCIHEVDILVNTNLLEHQLLRYPDMMNGVSKVIQKRGPIHTPVISSSYSKKRSPLKYPLNSILNRKIVKWRFRLSGCSLAPQRHFKSYKLKSSILTPAPVWLDDESIPNRLAKSLLPYYVSVINQKYFDAKSFRYSVSELLPRTSSELCNKFIESEIISSRQREKLHDLVVLKDQLYYLLRLFEEWSEVGCANCGVLIAIRDDAVDVTRVTGFKCTDNFPAYLLAVTDIRCGRNGILHTARKLSDR